MLLLSWIARVVAGEPLPPFAFTPILHFWYGCQQTCQPQHHTWTPVWKLYRLPASAPYFHYQQNLSIWKITALGILVFALLCMRDTEAFYRFVFFFHFCIVVALLLAAVKVLKSNFNFSLPPFLFLVHLSLCLSFSYSLSGIPLFTYAREEGQWQKGVNNACHSAFYQPGLMEKLKVNATTSLVAQLQLIDGSVSSCQPMNWIWMQSCTVKLSWT